MTETRQPTAFANKETVLLMYLATFLDGGVTERPAYDVSIERALIGAGLHAFAIKVEMLLNSKVVPDYSNVFIN